MTRADVILEAAWKRGAPGADTSQGFPRGFWPDIARVAVCMALDLDIDIEQTRCARGSMPEPARRARKSAGKISSVERAANTAALLAQLAGGQGAQ